MARKLDDDFKLEEDYEEEEQLTPAEALLTAQEYLSRAQKIKKGSLDHNTTMALKIMKDAISAPKRAGARRAPREQPRTGTPVYPTTTVATTGASGQTKTRTTTATTTTTDATAIAETHATT